MKKIISTIAILLVVSISLTACGQEKVMDTDFIRLQNKVKDIETLQKQKVDEQSKLSQKVADIEQALKQQKQQVDDLIHSSQDSTATAIHPVVIKDVKINSEKMDSVGRIWGPFNLDVTLYNGSDHDVSDFLTTIVMTDNPNGTTEQPKLQNMDQKFEIKAKESKTITFSNISIGQPSQRMNLVVKLMENAPATTGNGVIGRTTWEVVPTVIFPPNN